MIKAQQYFNSDCFIFFEVSLWTLTDLFYEKHSFACLKLYEAPSKFIPKFRPDSSDKLSYKLNLPFNDTLERFL